MNDSGERLLAYGPAAQDDNLPDRRNPPGLDALSFQGATYQAALARMLADVSIEPALSNLNVEAEKDWAVALLHAWAVVTEVLSFYQERIVNESFLRTATERRSVVELARTIGYDLQPGAAASTNLAFTIQAVLNEPPHAVTIPAGTAVQGMPATGKLPQVFETSQPLTARSDWNVLRLDSGDPLASVLPGGSSIRLAGSRISLKPGDPLLIVGDDGTPAGRSWLLAAVSEVQSDVAHNFTQVTWLETAWSPNPRQPIHNVRVFTLQPLGSPFGYTQAAVNEVSADFKSWWPAGIGLPQAEVYTLVAAPDGRLFAGTDQDVFYSDDSGAIWIPTPIGALRRKVTALAVAPGGALYAGTNEGGIYLSQDGGLSWMARSGETVVQPPTFFKKWLPFLFSAPLPKTTVRSLAAYPQGRSTLLTAGTDEGLYRSTDQGKSWQPASFDLPDLDWKTGLAKTPVWALATVHRGPVQGPLTPAERGRGRVQPLFAGTDGGVFRVKGSPGFWPLILLSLILALITLALPGQAITRPAILAPLLNPLIKLLAPVSKTLEPLKQLLAFLVSPSTSGNKLPNLMGTIKALVAFGGEILLVGALLWLGYSLFKRVDRWFNGRPARCLGQPVYALAVGAGGQLFAGTARGVYCSTRPPQSQGAGWLARLQSAWQAWLSRGWQPVNPDEAVSNIHAVAVSSAGDLYAGTAKGALFHHPAQGNAWERINPDWNLAGVSAILSVSSRLFVAGTPPTSKPEQHWGRAQLENFQIDLDKVAAPVSMPLWVVLRARDDAAQTRLYSAVQAAIVSSQDFTLPGKFTRLVIDANTGLETYNRATATIWAGVEAIPLFDDRPVAGAAFLLDSAAIGLTPGRLLVFSGKRARVGLVTSPDPSLALHPGAGHPPVPLETGEQFLLLSLPQAAAGAGLVRWQLRNRRGLDGFVDAPAGAFIQAPAAVEDEIVAETAQVESVEVHAQTVRISLLAPLQNVYDRINLVIYGNVVPATNGQTVRNEVLGSGDGSQANQRFRLRQGPLCYTHAPTASGVESTLRVLVNGVEWHPVPFLEGQARDSRVYMVRQDARGNTSVIFGDGEQGARLPSGYEQVTASYRIGLGPDGNMPPGRLSQMQSSLPYVAGVNNPVAAEGGVGPESLAQARQSAPITARDTNRIVSLTDYEDFVERFAGVDKVQSTWLRDSARDLLHLTVAGTAGQTLPETSYLYRMLLQAINDNRDNPRLPLQLDSYEPVYFHLSARLLIDPDYQARLDTIQASVRDQICQAYGFDARMFGQDLTASQLVSLMQAVPGVVAVQLTALYLSTDAPGLSPVLAARTQNQTLPAQILMVDAGDGIQLEMEVIGE